MHPHRTARKYVGARHAVPLYASDIGWQAQACGATFWAMSDYQLAQLNIGRILAPLDSPQLAGFVARLEEINALAESSPGFVWRFQTEAGDATGLRPFEDDRMLVNFSVWTSAEALHSFVYRSLHVEVMRQRRQWFEHMDQLFTVLWWVARGHRPTVEEAIARLEHLRSHGPTPFGFTFQQRFPAPSSEGSPSEALPDVCPAT